MALVTIVIRDVADRFHGFLSSVMLEVATNVFVSSRMNQWARERIWSVMSEWHRHEPRGAAPSRGTGHRSLKFRTDFRLFSFATGSYAREAASRERGWTHALHLERRDPRGCPA